MASQSNAHNKIILATGEIVKTYSSSSNQAVLVSWGIISIFLKSSLYSTNSVLQQLSHQTPYSFSFAIISALKLQESGRITGKEIGMIQYWYKV